MRKSAADPEHIRAVRTGEALPEEVRAFFEPTPDDGSTERMFTMIAAAMDELVAEGFDVVGYRQEIEREYGTGAGERPRFLSRHRGTGWAHQLPRGRLA
jgi:hypothetical protein